MDSKERLIILKSILGEYPKNRGNEITWGCPFCQQMGKDTHGDNFSFNLSKNAYACIAVHEHTKQISGLIRERLFVGNPQFRTRKIKTPQYLPLNEMPQEIIDYWAERKITIEALNYFKVKYDQANISMDFPTNTFQDKKKVLFHEEKNRSNAKQKKIGNNTVYPVNNKYEGQKKFIYLEGEPDLWCMYSNFPKEFFQEYYVATTLHGASHIPMLWKDVKYWNNYDEVYLCGDNDTVGQKAIQELKSIIGEKAKIIILPFKHQRLVNGLDVFYTSKDFNDWIIEGGTYLDFVNILSRDNTCSEELSKAVQEIRNHPNKLQLLIDDVHKLGVVGEETLIGIIFLSLLSYKFDTCLGFVVKGRFSSGKSHVLKTVASLFPQEQIIMISSFSKLALQYMLDLSNKILIQTEEPPADDPAYWEINSQLRQLISEGEITRAITEKNPQTNKQTTVHYKVKGPIVYGSTTTQAAIHEENESRLLVLQTNDTASHIAKVKDMLDKQVMGLWTPTSEQELIQAKWRRFITSLPSMKMNEIGLPFSDQLQMCIYGSDMIRDYVKLQKLMKIMAFFDESGNGNQVGKKGAQPVTSAVNVGIEAIRAGGNSTSGNDPPYLIFVQQKHYKIIYDLTRDFFNSKATKISQSVFRHYESVKSAFRQLSFTSQRVANTLIMTKRGANKLIRTWVEENMVILLEEKGERGANQYKVNEEWEVIDAELTPPEHINKEVGVNGKVIGPITTTNGYIKQQDGPKQGSVQETIRAVDNGTGGNKELDGQDINPISTIESQRDKDAYEKMKHLFTSPIEEEV